MPWRFKIPDNKPTKIFQRSTMKYYNNSCHKKPMWCSRRNILNRVDFTNTWKGAEGDSTGADSNNDFKIALAAMNYIEDFATLQEQFGSLKD